MHFQVDTSSLNPSLYHPWFVGNFYFVAFFFVRLVNCLKFGPEVFRPSATFCNKRAIRVFGRFLAIFCPPTKHLDDSPLKF